MWMHGTKFERKNSLRLLKTSRGLQWEKKMYELKRSIIYTAVIFSFTSYNDSESVLCGT